MNEPLNVLILDDDQFCIDRLKQMLEQYQDVRIVGDLTDTSDYDHALQTLPADLVFLDINLGPINGFSVAEFTRRKNPEIMIVFITGFDNFAVDGYEYEPLDFLVKPIDGQRLNRTLSRAREKKSHINGASQPRVGCQLSTGFQYIAVSSVLFIERSGRKVQMKCQTENGIETYTIRKSLTELESIFGIYGFVRVHQSILVPLNRITGISYSGIGYGYELTLAGWPERLPVSRDKYRDLKDQLINRSFL